MKFRAGAHTVYYTRYHLVFVTKYRRKVLKQGMGAYVVAIMKKSLGRRYPDIEILEVNTDADHIHLLVSIPPSFSVATAVQYMKGYSAHAMRDKFAFLDKVYYGSDGLWSDGYFVSTVGADERSIKRYIEHQGEVDSGQAELEL